MRNESLLGAVLKHRLTPPAFILVLFFLLYSPSLTDPFLNYDDDMYLYDNPLVTEFDLSKIPVIFSTEQMANFSPMVTLSFALEHKLWGLNPAGFRLVSFLLHAGSIVLLYLLLLRLFSDRVLATLTALMFAVHPLRIEALVWLSSRKDSLFGFFLLLSLNLYLSYLRRRKNSHYLFSLLSLSVALLAKVTAMIALPLLLLIDWREKRKFNRAWILDKIPFALVILLLGLTNTSMLLNSKYGVHQGWSKLPLVAAGSLSFLVVRFFWPFHLSVHYPDRIEEFLSPWWLFLLLAVLFFVGTAVLLRGKRVWSWGVLFMLTALFPVWMFMLRGYPMADRFTYLPFIGVGLLTISAFRELVGRVARKRLRAGIGVLVLGLLLSVWGTAHYRYLPVWRDNMIFWSDQIAKYPRIHQNYNSRAVLLKKAGQYEPAIRDLDRAIELLPGYAKAHWNRGLCYDSLGRYEKAEQDLLACVLLDPDFFQGLIMAARAGAVHDGYALALRAGHLLEAKGYLFASEPVFSYIMAYLNAREKSWQAAEVYIEKAISSGGKIHIYMELKEQIRARDMK